MNRIVIVGNLTRDPELKYTTSGVPVANFGVAVNRFSKDAQGNREVDFINCVAFRHSAEFLSQYGTKGRKIGVDGRLQIRSYVGQDGIKRTVAEVVADSVDLLDRAPEGATTASHQHDTGAGAPAADADDFADPFAEV